jgi:hypothetical protein
MKKLSVLVWVFVMVLSTSQIIFADDAMEVVYVSSLGDEENDGHSESTAKKELSKALLGASISAGVLGKGTKIIIIGALDAKQDSHADLTRQTGAQSPYFISPLTQKEDAEIVEVIITGKPGASETEKAKVSAKDCFLPNGEGQSVFFINGKIKVRFEHIAISSGSADVGAGLHITNGAEVTLGEGASIERNNGTIGAGVFVGNNAIFILAGGEIKNNVARDKDSNNAGGGGVLVAKSAVFIMDSGIISDNTAEGSGAGLYSEGAFTMNNGSIRNNTGQPTGGGVCVSSGVFNMNGGSITGNSANNAGGVFVAQGATFNRKKTGTIISNNKATTTDSEVFLYPDVYINKDAIYQRN